MPKNLHTKIVKSKFNPLTMQQETIKKMAAQQYSDYFCVLDTALPRAEQLDPKNVRPVIPGSSAAYGPVPLLCPVSNTTAKYRDPLTGTPFSDVEAFKILREKFFQKEEESLFMRM
jgi:hypothetical protein